MTEEKYIKWSDLIAFMRQHVSTGLYAENFIKLLETIPQADVDPKQRWIPVTDDNLPDEGEEVLVYDGCYRVAKIEKGISVNERERMKRGEIPDPEEWGWNTAEGYFRVKRSEAYKRCDEQGNNEKPYCWRADNGRGTLFGQNVKYWMPILEPPKGKENVNKYVEEVKNENAD